MRHLILASKLLSLVSFLCLAPAVAGLPDAPRAGTNAPGFGFAGPESFPIDPFIAHLRSADIDGDKLEDIIVVNNSRSKIAFLYNQTGRTNPPAAALPAGRRELNELPPDARFRIESIASEKRIAAFIVADLNSDRRPDLAYYGEPKELVVQYNQGTNGWSAPKRWPIGDGQLTPNALATGNLDGSGRDGLVLLSENHVYWLAQDAGHALLEPEKIPFSGAVKSTQVLDINGDERDDLLLVNWETSNPFRFRLQNASGQLGPETHFTMPSIRSYWADDLDGDRKTEIMTIAMQSGRAQISHFIEKPAETLAGPFKAGQFSVLPLNKTTKARRGQAWGDVNGDGRTDLIVAEPDSGQVTLYLQQSDGSLPRGLAFPSLAGVSDIALAGGGDGSPADVFLLSPDERQVGLTRFDRQGRLPFPEILPVEGKPLALAVGAFQAGQKPALAVLLDLDGRRTLLTRAADGKTTTQKLNESFKASPSSMAFHDADQDGLADLIVLIPYEKLKILRQFQDKAPVEFEEVDVALPGGTAEQPWMNAADIDGDGRDELLLAQKSFLRGVVLKPDAEQKSATNKTWSFTVRDQINGAGANSRLVGAAAIRGPKGSPSLFLLDAERKALTLSQRDSNGVWQVARNLPLSFSDFSELRPVALGGREPNAVAFAGVNAAGWLRLDGKAWEIAELDGYETPIKDGRLNDVISGDLNQDGRKDLVFLETARNYLDIVVYDQHGKLAPASRWQVFEERTFRARRTDSTEPREALIVDVTGDKKPDLVVLVHDRVLVYPQE